MANADQVCTCGHYRGLHSPRDAENRELPSNEGRCLVDDCGCEKFTLSPGTDEETGSFDPGEADSEPLPSRMAALAALADSEVAQTDQDAAAEIGVAQVHALLYIGDALHRCADAFQYEGAES